MDVIWSLGARYCVRQNAHAFILLWGLFVVFAGAALTLRRRKRGLAAVLGFLAICTVAVGVVIFAACSAYAPVSMGLPVSITATSETILRCLGKDAFDTAILWMIAAVSCFGAVGSILHARLHSTKSAGRVFANTGGVVLLLLAGASVFLRIFSFTFCSTRWVF